MSVLKYILVFSAMLNIVSVNSQPLELSTKSKKAKKAFEKGQGYFNSFYNKNAETYFLQATSIDPDFYEAHIMLGEVYEELNQIPGAINSYRNAIRIDSSKFAGIYYLLANLELGEGMYKTAEKNYSLYLSFRNTFEDYRKIAKKRIIDCRFAQVAIANPVPFDPVNLGMNINSANDEYFPCITADNLTLLITRLIEDPDSPLGHQEDFYISKREKENDPWQLAWNLGPPINSVYNEGAPSLSADGNVLFFTACESLNGYGPRRRGYGRCDLFISLREGDKWTLPVNVGTPLNSRKWESQPSFSSDGRTIYFVSNRHNNYDIWFSGKNEKNEWSEPEKMGHEINTDGMEGSVFIHPDNQTLYFSSDGHTGMGGMDIYYSRRDSSGNWQKPVNLGYPINTHKDENSILISAEGKVAFFASDRAGGQGGLDIYSFELYEEARPVTVTYLKGIVFDAENKAPLEAKFELVDLRTGELTVSSLSNKGNGEFLVCLPAGGNY
ncbi:MAG: hypothetical protein K8R53_04215, partial [Bacteroidales bacterium]|nr:hypothetical protein [Bacteroidales bacterium]